MPHTRSRSSIASAAFLPWSEKHDLSFDFKAGASPLAQMLDIQPTGTYDYDFDLQSQHCSGYTCCGHVLPDMHALIDHYDAQHKTPGQSNVPIQQHQPQTQSRPVAVDNRPSAPAHCISSSFFAPVQNPHPFMPTQQEPHIARSLSVVTAVNDSFDSYLPHTPPASRTSIDVYSPAATLYEPQPISYTPTLPMAIPTIPDIRPKHVFPGQTMAIPPQSFHHPQPITPSLLQQPAVPLQAVYQPPSRPNLSSVVIPPPMVASSLNTCVSTEFPTPLDRSEIPFPSPTQYSPAAHSPSFADSDRAYSDDEKLRVSPGATAFGEYEGIQQGDDDEEADAEGEPDQELMEDFDEEEADAFGSYAANDHSDSASIPAPSKRRSRPSQKKRKPTGKGRVLRDPKKIRLPCPRSGCVKTYQNPNGLKYHLEKGTCAFEQPTSA